MDEHNNGHYCKKCIAKDVYPGIEFNEEGLCNYCGSAYNIKLDKSPIKGRKMAVKNYMEFEKKLRDNNYPYNCLLMLSGGKDSMNILYKLNKENINLLAFTINHPFESKYGVSNIDRAIHKLNFEHVNYSPNIGLYNKIISTAFVRGSTRRLDDVYAPEKIPCQACTYYMQISAYVFAFRIGIPYILYCADPSQSMYSEIDIRVSIKALEKICGEDLFYEVFARDTINKILTGDENKLPKIVFPYILDDNYNAVNIMNELKELGLYEGSPIQTHCSLYSILNYYSLKYFGCPFYFREFSTEIRNGNIDREHSILILEELENVILNIATKENISEADKMFVLNMLKSKYSESETELAMSEYENILGLRETASKLGIYI